MYDMKNKYDRYYIRELVLFNEPINFYGFNLYCPTIKDILSLGEIKYTELLSPIICDLSFYTGNNNFDDNDLFNYIFKQKENSIISSVTKYSIYDLLVESLAYFFKLSPSKISACVNNSFMVIEGDKSLILDIEKFKELRDIICEITSNKVYTYLDIKKEDLITNKYSSDPIMNERIKRYEKAKKEYSKTKQKTENKIVELYNVMAFVCNYKGYNVVKEYNIYQLINTYEFINAETSFKFNLRIASSGFAGENFKLQDIREMLAK